MTFGVREAALASASATALKFCILWGGRAGNRLIDFSDSDAVAFRFQDNPHQCHELVARSRGHQGLAS